MFKVCDNALGGWKEYGLNNQVCILAPFGLHKAVGLRRRPTFVSDQITIKAIARNAWCAGVKQAEGGTKGLGKRDAFVNWATNYQGFCSKDKLKSRIQEEVADFMKQQIVG